MWNFPCGLEQSLELTGRWAWQGGRAFFSCLLRSFHTKLKCHRKDEPQNIQVGRISWVEFWGGETWDRWLQETGQAFWVSENHPYQWEFPVLAAVHTALQFCSWRGLLSLNNLCLFAFFYLFPGKFRQLDCGAELQEGLFHGHRDDLFMEWKADRWFMGVLSFLRS